MSRALLRPARSGRPGARRARRLPHLIALGTATPPMRVSTQDVGEQLAAMWRLDGADLARWRRIIAGTGIDFRYGVMPIAEVLELSTRQRMEAYERLAPDLAAAAARGALAGAALEPRRVTDLVVVSCTGFSAPGLDVGVVECLGLPPTVRRTVVGFMGCFGAIIGLRTAIGACMTHPGAVALVVCLELCSLHLRPDRSAHNQVASALFGDGAAAAIVAGHDATGGGAGVACRTQASASRAIGRLEPGRALLLPQGRDWMSWRVTDSGFAMTLTREVPGALRDCVAGLVNGSRVRPKTFIVHPGGPAILDAVDGGLRLAGGSGLSAARDVLRRCGNMSSATVLFVLEEAMRRGCPLPAMLLAFGPGLAVETLGLRPA